MGFLTNLLNPIRASYSPESNFWYEPIHPQTQSGAFVGVDTGLYVSAVFQAIRLISESLAKVPLHIYRRDGDARERMRDHNIALTLGRKPNNNLTSYQFRCLAQAQILTRGNHYSQIVRTLRGDVAFFNPLHPDCMQVKKLPRRYPNEPLRVGYLYTDPENGRQQSLSDDEVFHLKGPMLSSSDIIGVSALQYARETIGSAITQQSYSDTLFRQGAMHRGLYSVPGKLDPDQHKQMLEMVKRETSGPSSWGSSLLLSNGATWTSTGMTAADAEFLLSRKFTVIEVARWFNLAPHLLRDLEKSSYSNIETESLEFATVTMLPHFCNWEQTIDIDLIGGNMFFSEFLLDAIVRADLKTRYDAYGTAIEKGFMVPNEARQKENWNAIEGLDRPRISLNVAMIDENGDIIPSKTNGTTGLERPTPSQNGNRAPAENGRQAHYDQLLNRAIADMNGIETRELRAIFHQNESTTKQKDEGLKFYDRFAAKLSRILCIKHGIAEAFVSNQAKRFLAAVEAGAADEILEDLEARGQDRLLAFVMEDGLAEENGKRAVA